MKKQSILSLVLYFLLMATAGFSQNYPPYDNGSVDDQYYDPSGSERASNDQYSYEEFYDDLATDGSWINYPQYGYVWVPRVSADFQPYATEGHWVMTNYGWTWVSDYRWGWATFHYGRWAFEPRWGWMWIPGRQWGPAWVSWRESDDYFGWAPLGPYVRIGINISCPNDHYRFVQRRYFASRDVYRYYSDRRDNERIINRTTYINETHIVNKNKYYYGPRKDYVERATGQRINVANVYDNNRPGADRFENDRVNVYRPRMDKAPSNGRNVPKKVVAATDLQPISADRRLTSSVKQRNTEGGQMRPQGNQPRRNDAPRDNSNAKREQMPNNEPRPEVRQPRRTDVPQVNPNTKREQMPNNEPRPEVRQLRRTDAPQVNPNTKREQLPNNEPRPEVRQPRRTDVPQANPNTKREQMPNNNPRPEVIQPRRTDAPRATPNATRQQMPNNEPRPQATQPEKQKEAAPQKGKSRGHEN